VGLALGVPASALGAQPAATTLQDTAVACYLSPDRSECAILTLGGSGPIGLPARIGSPHRGRSAAGRARAD